MSPEKLLLEPVIDILGRAVLVGLYFVNDHAAFGVHFIVRKGRLRGYFHQERTCFGQVFLQYGGVQNYLLLGGVGIQFSAESVEVTVYH